MALILSIETATNICSVALHDRGKPLGFESLYKSQSHSGLLVPVIDSLLKHCNVKMQDLEAVAVSKGPGSYTGLRIGTSTAKGLCDALDIRMIAVNTLMAMANGVKSYVQENSLLCPMLDARRMEVYTLLCDVSLEEKIPTTSMILTKECFSKELATDQIYFFGNGSTKSKEVIESKNAVYLEGIDTNALHMGALAYEKYQREEFENVAYFEPFYLKEFQTTKPKPKK